MQIEKTANIAELVDFLADIQSGPTTDPEKLERRRKLFLAVAIKLFLYAPDEAVERFIEFKNSMVGPNRADKDPWLEKLGLLFVCLRKDLGHGETKLTSEDFWNAAFMWK
jgi:hypothetical protein